MIASSVLVLLVIGYLLYRLPLRESARAKLQFPPGPKGWPVIGNLMDLPPASTPDYQHWIKHKDTYGPISSVKIFGQLMIILHDKDAIRELMDKNSLKTSGRPKLEFPSMCGFNYAVALRQYDDIWKKSRKLMHLQLGTPNSVRRYDGILDVEVAHLLQRVLDTPEDLFQHFGTEAGAAILKISYGYTIDQKGVDPLVELVQKMMQGFSEVVLPLTWAVDILPALVYWPEWLPGGSFQAKAKLWRKINSAVVNIPYSFVRQKMSEGNAEPSFVSRLFLPNLEGDEKMLSADMEEIIKNSAANLYGGGADTTFSSFISFILAILKFPDVQVRAQEEIDNLTGGGRLPQFADRDSLPYIEGVVQEVLRWFPILPMGLVHTVDEDTSVGGYSVPKGTILLPGVWWLLHDPEVYAQPEAFDPSRFLAPRNEPYPSTVCFGFGRRICPGRHLAESSLFLTVAQMLAVFHIEKSVDSEGIVMEPQNKSTPGLIDRPAAFPYRITPRSPKHVDLIKKAQLKYPLEAGDAGFFATRYEELHQLLA